MDNNTEEDFTDLYGDDDSFIGTGPMPDLTAVRHDRCVELACLTDGTFSVSRTKTPTAPTTSNQVVQTSGRSAHAKMMNPKTALSGAHRPQV